jgi:2-polyprenyl-3-methyl-5-hydroxy-6-metoxy-1,4-benzoquinol methylase
MTLALTTYERRRIDALCRAVPSHADRILDVGCCRHGRANRAWGNLHAELHRRYPDAEIIGIDSDREAVSRMQTPGYDVRNGDAMQMLWPEGFDAVVAGDLIEHLPNPGGFLSQAADALRESGRLVVSTPNPAGYRYALRAAADNYTSSDHTCWIDPQQLDTLGQRFGLRLGNVEWVRRDTPSARLLAGLGFDRLAANGYVGVLE